MTDFTKKKKLLSLVAVTLNWSRNQHGVKAKYGKNKYKGKSKIICTLAVGFI